jgi:O-antigen ligase
VRFTLHNERAWNVLLPLAACAFMLGIYAWKEDLETTQWIIFAFVGALLVLLAIFFRLSWYYYALIACVPLSLETGLLGGARLNFPAEGMLALLVPVLLLFARDYRLEFGKALKNPLSILLLLDLVLMLVFSLFSMEVDVSLKRVLVRALFFIGFFGVIFLFQNPTKLIYPWIAYTLGLIPVMYFTTRNHIHHDFDPRVVFDICAPYFNDHTIYGACLAFLIPLLFLILIRRKLFALSTAMTWLLWLVFFWILVSEVLALSRAALLSIAVAVIFALLLKFGLQFRRLLLGLGVASVVVWGFSARIYENIQENEAVSNDGELVNHFSSVTNIKSDASNLERVNRWICAYRMFEDKPLTGYGPGTYQFYYNRFQSLEHKTYISTNSGDRGNAHSEYLTYLSETGIFGFLWFLLLIFYSLYLGMKNHAELSDPLLRTLNLGVLMGLVTFYFHGLFNSFIDQSKMAFLVFTALATLVWIRQRLPQKVEA